jgi:hypothetical protein
MHMDISIVFAECGMRLKWFLCCCDSLLNIGNPNVILQAVLEYLLTSNQALHATWFTLIFYLACSSTLKLEATCSS